MDSFPDNVRQFLLSSIASVEQLEILRVLGEDPSREWSSDEIREPAQVSPDSIRTHLQALEARGLIACRYSESQVFCQYGPHSKALDENVQKMLDLYRQRPVTMIRLVYERSSAALREFADAFRLGKKE